MYLPDNTVLKTFRFIITGLIEKSNHVLENIRCFSYADKLVCLNQA